MRVDPPSSASASVIGRGRSTWTGLSDAQLLAQCDVDTYRASGPGGQKRNKTSSAVRLRHPPSGLIVIAEESRSQHENRARALRRLRQSLYLHLREPLSESEVHNGGLGERNEMRAALERDARLRLGRKDPWFWPAVGIALDALCVFEARVSDTARALGISTGNLIAFLRTDPKVWQETNAIRARFRHKPLIG